MASLTSSKKAQKAQIAIFVVIAIFLVVNGYLLIQSLTKGTPNPGSGISNLQQSQSDRDTINLFIKSCLEYTATEAITENGIKQGFSEPLISQYITENMPICTDDFQRFESEGFSVTKGEISPSVRITDDAVIVELSYPLEFSKSGYTLSFDKDTFELKRTILKTISPESETIIISDDKKTQFIIPSGTEATLDGEPVTQIGLGLLDREFDGQTNAVLAGMIAFRGLPDGVIFSKPITIIHQYEQSDIPFTVDEQDLNIGYYSRNLGVWIALPTTVDSENNLLISHTDHFTDFGVVLRCTGTQDLTEHVSQTLVQEDCQACEGWTNSVSPGIGNLWIQSDSITQGNKIGDAPQCEKQTNPNGTYYSYGQVDITGINPDAYTKYANNGDSCVWTKEGREPKIAIQDTANPTPGDDWDILIKADCPDSTDQCIITEHSFADSTLRYTLKVVNGDAPNACIKGRVLVRYKGFGIQKDELESYYLCDTEGEEALMPVIGGQPNEAIMSVCTKGENSVLRWVAKEGAEIIIDTAYGDASQRRGRAKCPEGDAASPAEPYPTCPEDYLQNYTGKSFKVTRCLDTRKKNFCDWFGDFPQMQYTKNMRFSPDTQLLVIGSALRNDRCWLMVEAQEYIGNYKPDFYVKLEQVQEYILGNTSNNETNFSCMSAGSGPTGTSGPGGSDFESFKACGNSNPAKGIDVSHWTGTIDWKKVAGAGVEFAFIKATESTNYVDDTFAANWKNAKQAGVLRGAYLYLQPGNGKAQADKFLKTLGSDYGELPPVADLEQSGVSPADLKAWLKEVEAKTGRKPMIYTSPGYWSGFGGGSQFKDYPLWIAHWGVNCPTVPSTWKSWAFWQYAGESSTVIPGIPSSSLNDLNYFNGNAKDLKAYSYS
jgi:GH25 family lysozyme M1 (1,4-beta-N-acetylmuramidase)